MSAALLEALDAYHGIVCAVGAGGKKTTLYALARAHPGRVGLTATVFMASFSRRLGGERLITAAADLPMAVAQAARSERIVAWARPATKSGRVGGVPPASIAPTHAAAGFDLTLVKADGARMRAIKAPAEDEPVVPEAADTTLCLVSAAALDRPLDETIAHRPERIAAVTGLALGEPLIPAAVGRLLAAPDGALRNLPPTTRVIPVINAVDNGERHARAREAARAALAATERFDRVILTRHDPTRQDGCAEVVASVTRERQ